MRLDNLVKVGQLKAHVPDAPFQRARQIWRKHTYLSETFRAPDAEALALAADWSAGSISVMSETLNAPYCSSISGATAKKSAK